MSAWIVYSKDGTTERCRLKKLEYSGSFMNERTVTATFECESEVAFDVFDYIEYRGEKFELEAIPSVKKTSSHNYEYELRFVSLKYELERCEMRDIVPNDNGIVYPTPLTFSFTGDVAYLAERIQANLDALYGKGVWSIIVAEGVTSEDKNITISQQNCWNALSLVNTTYELDFTVKGRVVTIGGNKPSISHVFQYGKGKGLYEIERSADTETGIVTKLRAYGGTKNLDYSYPKKPEWSDSILDTSFVLSPLRLMLPSFKTDGKTDYIMADDQLVAKYGIREASVIYEDIYPSITGATNSKGEAIDEIKAVDDIDDSKSTFAIHLHDLGFDLEENLTTANAQVSMKTGAMQGYTFNIADNGIERLDDGSYKLTLGRITASSSDTDNYDIPNSKWNMKAGDKFVFLNILMPQEYIRSAENRLLERAKEYLAEYGKTNFSYNVGLHDKFLKQNQSVYNELIEGSKLSVYDEELGISENVTIQSISITENMEDNILPQVKVTLNNKPSASTLDRIQGQIKELSENASNSFTSQSELLQQYRRKLDKPFFDRLFVAVGTNGKELASTDTTSPIAYIKAKYSFVTVGGVTMYAQDGSVDIPTIAEGLPFDNRTIWFNPNTKQIEVIGGTGGSEEGVSNFWDLSGIPLWITNEKPKYSYSEIEGTPDLSKYALVSDIPSLSGYATQSWVESKGYALNADLTTLSTKVNDFLEGSDTDNIINKWKELEAFLSGLSQSDNLATILGNKAEKTDLTKYIPIAGVTDITGEKNFIGGLKVNGSPIYYDTEKKYWKLEGDLLVTGGVTMYGNDSDFVASTIMDAIAVDGTTISKEGGVLRVIGGTGGGSVTGDYLPLTGGTLYGALNLADNVWNNVGVHSAIGSIGSYKGQVAIKSVSNNSPGIAFFNSSATHLGSLQCSEGALYWRDNIVLNANNYSSYALPLSGGTLRGNLTFGVANNTSYYDIDLSRNGNFIKISNSLYKLSLEYKYQSYATYHGLMVDEYGAHYTQRTDLAQAPTKYTLWHSGNDGSGSGLDADMLDGLDATAFFCDKGASNSFDDKIYNGAYRTSSFKPNDAYGYGLVASFRSMETCAQIYFPDNNGEPQFRMQWNSQTGITRGWTGLVTAASIGNYNAGSATRIQAYTHDSGDKVLLSGTRSDNTCERSIYDNGWGLMLKRSLTNTSGYIATLNDNVASATKLQTARTIWGQSFDGTGDVDGDLTANGNITMRTGTAFDASRYLTLTNNASQYGRIGIHFNGSTQDGNDHWGDGGRSIITFRRKYDTATSYTYSYAIQHNLVDNTLGILYGSNVGIILNSAGNVGIGTTNPESYKLYVNGFIYSIGGYRSAAMIHATGALRSDTGLELYQATPYIDFHFNSSTADYTTRIIESSSGVLSLIGSLIVTGGITMYSDQRKKTILNYVELSLQQVANAPLIEHYYNSDQNKTTHVGSIAQYWAEMNDWFCKKDSEGFYTMEIQNAALASAISVARELVKFEDETDRRIKLLEEENKRLKEEVEYLKLNIA